MSLHDHNILFFDGACGTNLQAKNLPDSIWDGYEGCTEILSVTAPEVIIGQHQEFLDAGSQLIETNTFGAARVVMSEYGLEHRVVELNQIAVENARKAIGDRTGCYIAGSVGPGTKLPSLGHITVDDLASSAHEQVHALVEAGGGLPHHRDVPGSVAGQNRHHHLPGCFGVQRTRPAGHALGNHGTPRHHAGGQ